MSRENVEIVRSIYEAFNRRDWDAAFRDQHPDVELTTPPGAFRSGTYRGREELQRFWEDMLDAFEAVSADPEELFESGEQVVAFVRIRARLKDSSAEIEIRNGHLWALRDGVVRSMRMFPKPEDALEATGLSE